MKRTSSSLLNPHEHSFWAQTGLQFGEQPLTGGGRRRGELGNGGCERGVDERPIQEKNWRGERSGGSVGTR